MTGATGTAAAQTGGVGLGWQLFYFLAVAALLIAGAYYTVRWLGRRMASPGVGRRMAVRETMGLGPRSGLCLVEVDGRRLLIGFSPAGLNLICDLTAPVPPVAPGLAPVDGPPSTVVAPVSAVKPVEPEAALRRWFGSAWARLSTMAQGQRPTRRRHSAETAKVEEAIRALEAVSGQERNGGAR